MTLALAYSFVPTAIYFVYKYLEAEKKSYLIYSILVTFLICILEFRFGFITIGLVSLILLMQKRFKNILLFISTLILLNSYWVLPSFLSSFLFSNGTISRGLFGSNFFTSVQAIFLHHPFWTDEKVVAFSINYPNIFYIILPACFVMADISLVKNLII